MNCCKCDTYFKDRLRDTVAIADKLEAENKRLRKRVGKLEEVLEFYADEKTYEWSIPKGIVQCYSNRIYMFPDGGKRAKEALNEN